ncbi:beta-hexosaminidase [Burkholderia multivorans]|uniref:beta-hexosaminidase n=1 Tax=Burkholderia multivorans TaxID=87883 RepID=UPI000D0129E4|nr:beta-hexosaminidase [Burkholderia multivorans]MDN7759676.1 beta-hexosaminidase [Burkholderia multivorans]PRH46688.1 beta-hexosaminidase [Burkholderia multivorans]
MSRIKVHTHPILDVGRRDTLSLRSVVRYDRNTKRPTTPILVGKYIVARRPLADSVHTLYMILDGAEIAGTQISYPTEADCATAIKRLRDAKHSLEAEAAAVVARAKKPRKARALTIRETA